MNDIKKYIIQFFDFYIFSNLHVALSAFSLTKITLLEVGISENSTPWFVFFSTLITYNFIRFSRLNSIKNWMSNWIIIHKTKLYLICGSSLTPLFYLLFQLRFKALLILLPFGLLTLLYIFPFKRIGLRNISGLKIFLIAISWAGITVLFPLIQNCMTIQTSDWINFTQRFLMIILITLPFDLRDLAVDSIRLKTIPQQIGIQKTKMIGIFLGIFFFILEFFKRDVNLIRLLVVLFIALLSSIFLLKAPKYQNKYYSAFSVEAIPILWFVLWSMATNICVSI